MLQPWSGRDLEYGALVFLKSVPTLAALGAVLYFTHAQIAHLPLARFMFADNGFPEKPLQPGKHVVTHALRLL